MHAGKLLLAVDQAQAAHTSSATAQQFYFLKRKLNVTTYIWGRRERKTPYHISGVVSFLYPHVGPRDQVQVGRLGGQYSHPVTYPPGPNILSPESLGSVESSRPA